MTLDKQVMLDAHVAFELRRWQEDSLRATIGGADVRRSYSICSAVQDDALRIAVKKSPGGVFSTWANETGAARPDVIEACLAHEEGNRVRAAYNRAQFNEERAALLRAWADFLAHSAQVLNFKAA